MYSRNLNIDNLRTLSQIFSPPTIREIVRDEGSISYRKKIQNHFNLNKTDITNKEIFKKTYKYLLQSYRCEYVYKNNLICTLLEEYSLADTVIFDEFNIASSKADLVLLNGCMKVYEIKTELDDFSRLSSQIENYQKVADEIYIVTDNNSYENVLNLYSSSNIGVISLSEKNKIQLHKKARKDSSLFDFDAIFKLLRKQEFLNLTDKFFGYIPDVPNTIIFKECYNLLHSLDLSLFQKEVVKTLKARRAETPALLKSQRMPKELKYVCNTLNLNQSEYEILFNFLNQKYHVPSISKREAI